MKSQDKDLLIWIIVIILFVGVYIFAKDLTAAATIALAFATFTLARDSSKNIEISKNNLIKEHLTREMKQLIIPMYKNRDLFEYNESHHVGDLSRDTFWNDIDNNRYLAAEDLRESIELYLRTIEELYQKPQSIRENIRSAYQKEKDHIQVDLDTILNKIGSFPRKDERCEELKKISEKLDRESEVLLYVKEYIDIVENNNLEDRRSKLRNKVISRYEELEKKMDEIRKSLEGA